MSKDSPATRFNFSKTWIFGALTLTTRKILAGALYEFIYLILWSVLPFVLGGFVLYLTSPDLKRDFMQFAVGTFRNGELLVFTISMLAPTLYLIYHDPDGAGPFPHKFPLGTIVTFVIVFSAALFGLQKAGSIRDADSLFGFSLALTFAALFFRLLAMVYHRVRMPAPSEKTLREDEVNFVESFGNRAGGGA